MKLIDYVLDAFAWIEYAIGSAMGKFVDRILKNAPCYTPSVVIAELSDKFHRESKFEEWDVLFRFIKNRSTVVPLDEILADQSGKQKHLLRKMEEKDVDMSQIGLADAIIYQTTLNLKGTLVTGDDHFKSVPFVVFLKDEKQLTNELEEI
ncbi:MAG: type II toxin-antitoxin system VapC family toxin [Promethearchaeota archaeon]|nr:MAG: type II toxin-antitoxin system VapC family toxin [Candidatus Lokiarchaeota archaeon]